MGGECKILEHLRHCCSIRLQEKQSRSIFDVGTFLQNRQCRFYCFRSPHRFTKRRDLGPSPPFKFPSTSPFFSTLPSNRTPSKIGFLRWYLGKLDSHPLLTKSISSSLIYAAADLTSQVIMMPSSSSMDLTRTLRMAAYGMLILGPSQHFWFNYVSKILPKRDTLTTVKKLFMGQAIYGPSITTVFFSYNAALQGESGGEIVARLKRDLLPTLASGLLYWPICDFFTYKLVAVHLQPLVNSSCSYVWTIYLTYMASLKKVSTS